MKQQAFNATNRAVQVPEAMQPLFDAAQQTVQAYFSNLKMDPGTGTIEINDQRYILIRASALSNDFLGTIQSLYADRGEYEALTIGKHFLFDIAHAIGMNDAKNFHAKMQLTDPLSKLSAGPIHFAYTGWAYVDILPESNPTADENFYLIYRHPYSFEADSWKRAGKTSPIPVCIMNAGYSSGWCSASFGIPLTAVEVSCTARGDDQCLFIMSPPNKIQEHLDRYHAGTDNRYSKKEAYEIPSFFERKRVEEEMQKSRLLAEESAQSKSDFIANMSHELRTPLGAILGFTDLLKKTEISPVQKDYIDAISNSGNSLLSIINDILDLSKLDAGRFIIEQVPFSVPELIHSVQVMFSTKAKEKSLKFKCTVDTAINYQVLGDPMRLTQILINLIGNAIKFTEQGGVYVSCIEENDNHDNVDIRFTIKDTGIGISAEKKETIFERFTQAETHITRKYGGTGLGLAITKQLVALQGGQLTVTSEEGKGSEFSFVIPYSKSTMPTSVNNGGAKDLSKHLKFRSIKRVLVIEDNLMNQKLTAIILQNNGFDAAIAENGRKAIDLLQQQQQHPQQPGYDLVLMDIQMPVMDGYRTTQIIRDELHIATPIIAMTAHALAGEKARCLQTGMNDYLSKPFSETELLLKMAMWDAYISREPELELSTGRIKIIDLSFLIRQTNNNRPFIKEMISIFTQQNPQDLATLQEAIDNANWQLIYKTTHAIRNAVGFFGINHLIGNDLLVVEKLAKTGEQIEEIRLIFNKIKSVCEQAVNELEGLEGAF
jgi:signal transduction histidine kinase/AmiR/NasT family two-component response regulator/predicted hydrocarbon binding protein/HPt (histidine-containing phosphotransfer) domain-containing protein